MEALKESEQQFTIFYSGGVNVFHHVPAHKARAVMLLLSDDYGSSGNSVLDCRTHVVVQARQPQLIKSSCGVDIDVGRAKASYLRPRPAPAPSTLTTVNAQITHFALKKPAPTVSKRLQAELIPFARKASLARFLEKRKDRVLEAMKRKKDVCACGDADELEPLRSPCKRIKP